MADNGEAFDYPDRDCSIKGEEVRPLPARPAGEAVQRLELLNRGFALDPCRLVRQVKQFRELLG